VGSTFLQFESAWYAGLSAMARSGAGVIVDEVFLGGADTQTRLRSTLKGLAVLWVAVRCAPEVAEARERARPNRIAGMAVSQAALVHDGVVYDVEVETTRTSAMDCALAIATHVVP
jgi:chloramphenicol 3-O phosphotransferase